MKKALNSVLALTAVAASLVTLASCGNSGSNLVKNNKNWYALFGDKTSYDLVLGDFNDLYSEARDILDDNDERFVKMAEAEAELLASGVFVPTTTQGGAYTVSRVVPRTVPYVQWGVDVDRLKSAIVVDKFITKADRAALIEKWQDAREGEAGADYSYAAVKSWLASKGYTVQNVYKSSFSTAPQTWDALATSRQNDTEQIIWGLDGLVEYDNLGQQQPAIADALPEVSADGKTYTFTINANKATKATWVSSAGQKYADVVADDFVAGFQHMLDASGGLEYLVDGVVKGVHEYLAGTGSFDNVGVKANGNKLTITLVDPLPYFETMLTYNIFFPMNRAYFQSKGGVFGVKEFANAKSSSSYTYGKSKDDILYNGAFLCSEVTANNAIKYTKNNSYYNPGIVNLTSAEYKYDDGSDPKGSFDATIAGDYAGTGLSSSTLPFAETTTYEGKNLFSDYAYISDTTATTYFGGWNLNRRTFALSNGNVASPKTNEEARAYATAIVNRNFRNALAHSFDRKTYNAVSRGANLAEANLRNMYTSPNLVSLNEDFTYQIGNENVTFGKGSTYGQLVQKFIDKKYNGEFNVADGKDGWYNPTLAKSYLEKAITELDAGVFAEPIKIDVEYYAASVVQKGQAEATKASFEEALTLNGRKYVEVNLVEATTTDDYYEAGYYAPTGADADYDLFYGSGWGPDYGDPSTYLDTYLPDGLGYMTKVNGLW